MREAYMLGGSVNVRLRLHERMKHDCFVAKQAYEKFCKDLRDPKNKDITEEEAVRLYESYKKEDEEFISAVKGIKGTIKHE